MKTKKCYLTLILLILFCSGCSNSNEIPIKNMDLENMTKTQLIEKSNEKHSDNKKYFIANNNYKEINKKENICYNYHPVPKIDSNPSNYYYNLSKNNYLTIYKRTKKACTKVYTFKNTPTIFNLLYANNQVYVTIMSNENNMSGLWAINDNGATKLNSIAYFPFFAFNEYNNHIYSFSPYDDFYYLREFDKNNKKVRELKLDYDNQEYSRFYFNQDKAYFLQLVDNEEDEESSDLIIEEYDIKTLFQKLGKSPLSTKKITKFDRSINFIRKVDGLIAFNGGVHNDNEYTSIICTVELKNCYNYDTTLLLKNQYILILKDTPSQSILTKFNSSGIEQLLSNSNSFIVESHNKDSITIRTYEEQSDNYRKIKFTYKQ